MPSDGLREKRPGYVCANKPEISDEKIIELYENGWSINDIVARYKIQLIYVRKLLQDKGIATHKYRSAPEFWKLCVFNLLAGGFPTPYVSKVTDISPHLIREFLSVEHLKVEHLRADHDACQLNLNSSDRLLDFENFLQAYRSGGCGFMNCISSARIPPEYCCWVVSRLKASDIEMHTTNLRMKIDELRKLHVSSASIAKKLGVSVSIVRNIVK